MAKKKITKKKATKVKRKPTAVRKRVTKKTSSVASKKAKTKVDPARAAFAGLTIRDCKRAAKSKFHIDTLHDEQIKAMRALLRGNDTIAVLPTGFGKSLIYQALGCIVEQPVITISPLIALMRDQELALIRANVNVIRIDSSLGKRARADAIDTLKAGGQLFVLTTPESLQSKDVRAALKKRPPALITIDEAHCISEWGHDFRPAYLGLGTIRKQLGNPALLALTATATIQVQSDISDRLQMQTPVKIVAPPYRANLRFDVRKVPGSIKLSVAGKLIRKLRRPGIIYCSTTKAVDEIYGALRKAKIPATRYHGKMAKNDRERQQKEFFRRRTRKVMVATSAFGMGIDKPNIRYVMHYQVPGSIEQYVQEAGRAGRDGRPANCILLFDEADLDIQQKLITKSHVNLRQLHSIGDALCAWANAKEPVSVDDLALSAAVQKTSCRALCHRLEEAGLIETNDDRKLEVKVSGKKLRAAVGELGERFQIVQRGDIKRLNLMADYARSSTCRSAYLNTCFDDTQAIDCGVCDRCKSRSRAS